MKPDNVQHRDTVLLVDDAEILAHDTFPGEQHVLRLLAPGIAERAQPGSFVHLSCDPMLPMRRPLSIMRAQTNDGWIELLYRVFGYGTALLAQRRAGERLSVLGPIGRPFTARPDRRRPLLIGGGVGIPPMIFLAEVLRRETTAYHSLVLMGSEVPFPFTPKPSQIMCPGIPDGVIAAVPLLEDWGIASRLASGTGFSGCFEGYVTDLARLWLASLTDETRKEVEVFACGPQAMLEATARLAHEFDLPCQVSLEEFMACAVGGCAGCTVAVQTSEGPAMKRVCVDGPVFDAATVFPQ
jgi:dihydroorotate dehydrogenase electron transfer subunit